MANILVYIELVDDEASWASLLALRQARYLSTSVGATIYAVLPCAKPPLYGENDIIAILSQQGADKVILMTHKALAPPLVFESHGEALLTAASQFPPSLLLLPEGPVAVEIAPRVTARLGGLFVRHPKITVEENSTLQIDQPLFEDTHVRRFDTTELEHSVVAVVAPDPQQFSRALGTEEAEVVVISPGFDDETSAPTVAPVEGQPLTRRSQRMVLVGAGVTEAAEVEAISHLAETLQADLRITKGAAEKGVLQAPPLDKPALICRPDFILTFGVYGSPETLAHVAKTTYLVGVHLDKKAPLFQRAQLGLVAPVLEAAQQMLASAKAPRAAPDLPDPAQDMADPLPTDDGDKGDPLLDTLPPGATADAPPASAPIRDMKAAILDTDKLSVARTTKSPAIDQLAHTPPMGTPMSVELQAMLDASANADPTPVPSESAEAETPEATVAGAVIEASDPALDDTVPAPLPGGGDQKIAQTAADNADDNDDDDKGKPTP